MKRYILKLVTLALIVLVVAIGILLLFMFGFKDVYKNNYQKGYGYQYNALKNSNPDERKVIVIGGSYMTFATDSEELGSLLGISSYVLGIHSGMGMDYIMETALEFANDGDIIVFSFLPYSADTYGMDLIQLSLDGNWEMLKDFLTAHPYEFLTSIFPASYTKAYNLFYNLVKYGSIEGNTEDIQSVYDSRAFDRDTGNIVYERPESIAKEEDLFRNNVLGVSSIESGCIESMNDFKKKCEEKNVDVYLIYTPFFSGYYSNTSEETLQRFQKDLENEIDIPLIADVSDCVMPREYTYDGALHMNDKGKKCYTHLIYEALVNVLSEN